MNKTLFPMFGMMPAMNTPFTEDDCIDIDGLQKHIDNAIEAGICGFLIPVVASEVNKLTSGEREQIVRAALEANNHRVKMIGGASALNKEECLKNVKALLHFDIDGILVNIPYENDESYKDYVRSIAALNPPVLMIQDYDIHGGGVPVDLLLRLFDEIDCFRCVKVETLPAGPKYTAIIEASGNRLHVSGGWSITQLIDAWDRGVHAMANTGFHEAYCKIYELYTKGRRDKAVALYEKIQPVIAFSNQYTDISLHFFKHLLYRQGIYKTFKVRRPVLDYDKYFRRIGDEMIEKALHIIHEIKQGVYDPL
ncbi:MAG: dihydrodipicolinate synthase family protein [Treponema sp.]|jgi:4-hydroxy-tetrahydrodipicolinate synthase|nr:dihydrodipicolinate synthase family protein [Treponema sp.]